MLPEVGGEGEGTGDGIEGGLSIGGAVTHPDRTSKNPIKHAKTLTRTSRLPKAAPPTILGGSQRILGTCCTEF
jgi:hypothetical protein